MRLSFVSTALATFGLALTHHGPSVALSSQVLAPRGNLSIASFEHAKVHLRVLYAEHPETLYSGCAFTPNLTIDYSRCAYRPRRQTPRAHRIEWEHVVPAEAFGQAFIPWRLGDPACLSSRGLPYRGRRCAQRVSAAYRHIEGDLYNLVPEIGELNQIRSNHPMDAIDDPAATLVPLQVRATPHAFEPRPEAKGDVARTYLYMDRAYPGLGILSAKRKKLLRAWSLMDPVDGWECQRAFRIEAIQGNVNHQVKDACQRLGLWPRVP